MKIFGELPFISSVWESAKSDTNLQQKFSILADSDIDELVPSPADAKMALALSDFADADLALSPQ